MKLLTLDELRELAPGFVMGTLSIDERRAFEAAMNDRTLAAELEPELDAHRAAAEFLASAHAVTPPPALKGRVMQQIQTQHLAQAKDKNREQSHVPNREQNRSASGSPSSSDTSSSDASIIDLQARRESATKSRAGGFAAFVMGIGFAASLLFAIDMRGKARDLEQQLATEQSQLAQTKQRLAERDQTLATILGSGSDVTLVRLSPSQPKGPGMQVFWNTSEGRAIISASGLAPIARDRAYALWMIRDGKPVPLALFNPDASGHAVVQDIAVPTDLQGVAAFAVTEEPAGGSPQPTMTPFLVGAVPK